MIIFTDEQKKRIDADYKIAEELAAGRRYIICNDLGNLGIKLDVVKNRIRGKETIISRDDSRVKLILIPTNEELMIARDTVAIVTGKMH